MSNIQKTTGERSTTTINNSSVCAQIQIKINLYWEINSRVLGRSVSFERCCFQLSKSYVMLFSIIHLGITLVLQWFMMRDLEKLTGSLRIMIIYMGSGVGGNLASAIFVPYRADVSITSLAPCLCLITLAESQPRILVFYLITV